MLRFSYALRAICLGSVAATLAACAPNTPAPASAATNANAYDAYYGFPPQQGSSQHGGSLQTQPNAPQTYVVKKGDTLWGIAKKFLTNPWYWPELWDKNQNLANPHQLYPGDILHFGYMKSAENGQLVPRIRVERKGYQGQPIATVAAFLQWPRIMDEAAIRQAPYLLESRDGHTLIAPGERTYAKGLRQAQLGQRYAIYSPDQPLHDPETGRLLGHQVKYKGLARLERLDTLATLTILDTYGAVRPGDRLVAVEQHPELQAPIQISPIKIRGRIVGLYEANYLSTNYMVMAINRGKQHGLKPGYTVGIYHEGRTVEDPYQPRGNAKTVPTTLLPPEKVANAIVYLVEDHISYALIMDSAREVKNGDKIGNP